MNAAKTRRSDETRDALMDGGSAGIRLR